MAPVLMAKNKNCKLKQHINPFPTENFIYITQKLDSATYITLYRLDTSSGFVQNNE